MKTQKVIGLDIIRNGKILQVTNVGSDPNYKPKPETNKQTITIIEIRNLLIT
jgi:hypothetical protein